ncbi:MAG: hypothetical protein KJO82_15070, partial [Gammaproteobacteria bacterium]|nr:hypothetical protein [Gammaproteobacteria bacterium]
AAAGDGSYPFAGEAAALSWPGVSETALLAEAGRVRLAVAGESLDMEDLARRAARLGPVELVRLRAIPMDSRHNSKVDYIRLRRMMR